MKTIKAIDNYIQLMIKAAILGIGLAQLLFGVVFIVRSIDYFTPRALIFFGIYMGVTGYCVYVWLKYYYESNRAYRAVLGALLIAGSPFSVIAAMINENLLMLACLCVLFASGLMMAIKDKSKFIPLRLLISVGALSLIWLIITSFMGFDLANNLETLKTKRCIYPYIQSDYDSYTGEQKKALSTLDSSSPSHFYTEAQLEILATEYPELVCELNEYEYSAHELDIKNRIMVDSLYNLLPGLTYIKKMQNGGSVRIGYVMSQVWQACPDYTCTYLYLGSIVNILLTAFTPVVFLAFCIKCIVMLIDDKANKKRLPKLLASAISALFIYILAMGITVFITVFSIPYGNITLGVLIQTACAFIPLSYALSEQASIQKQDH